jgi:hypothetical protein
MIFGDIGHDFKIGGDNKIGEGFGVRKNPGFIGG